MPALHASRCLLLRHGLKSMQGTRLGVNAAAVSLTVLPRHISSIGGARIGIGESGSATCCCASSASAAAAALPRVGRGTIASAADILRLHTRHSSTSSTSSSSSTSRNVRAAAAGASDAGGASGGGTVFTLPTILTLARVAAVPAVVAAWFWQSPHATAAVTGLFVAASLTDWLDGYLARKLNASSAFGAFLDPVADKLMVAAALILLCTRPLAAGPLAGNEWLVPACTLVIIGREIAMSALREWAATLGPEARGAVAVNQWGKVKTACQMVALTALLLTRDGVAAAAAAAGGGAAVEGALAAAAAAGPPLLVVAAWLSAHSLALYLRGLWRFMV